MLKPVDLEGSAASCGCANTGSTTVLINGKGAVRAGKDKATGVIRKGVPGVLVEGCLLSVEGDPIEPHRDGAHRSSPTTAHASIDVCAGDGGAESTAASELAGLGVDPADGPFLIAAARRSRSNVKAPEGFPYRLTWVNGNVLKIGNNIYVHPDPKAPDFQQKMVNTLSEIMKAPTGRALIEEIQSPSPHKAYIHHFDQDALTQAAVIKNGEVDLEEGWKNSMDPTKGASAIIHLNPAYQPHNPLSVNPKPFAAVMFHELAHAEEIKRGVVDASHDPRFDSVSERRAIERENRFLFEIEYGFYRTSHGKHDFAPWSQLMNPPLLWP